MASNTPSVPTKGENNGNPEELEIPGLNKVIFLNLILNFYLVRGLLVLILYWDYHPILWYCPPIPN